MTQETTLDYRRLMQKMTDVVAHEIRNPLNNILLSTAQFKLDTPPDREDTSFYIDIIERNCDRINKLMEDLLSVMQGQRLLPDTFDLTTLLKEVLEEKKDHFELKKITCNAPLPQMIEARLDHECMKLALKHLVDNAMDAMTRGGTLTISLTAVNNEIRLLVQDTGEGIGNEVLPHIFVPFFTTRERHKGLGLAFVKSVTEAHNGRIEVATGAGGSCFTLHLPQI